MSESNACINKVVINEIRGKDLKSVSIALGEALSDEEPSIAMNAACDGLHTQNGVMCDGGCSVLHLVEKFPGRNGWLQAEMLQVAIELGGRQIRVDPIILEKARTLEGASRLGLRRFSGLPNTYDPLWQQLRDGGSRTPPAAPPDTCRILGGLRGRTPFESRG
ncbi:hypothetical protein AAHE18_17G152800 [Arachis hypogaea]